MNTKLWFSSIFVFSLLTVNAQNYFEGIISFTSDRDGDNEIYLMYPDSTELTKLTDNSWDDVGHGWSSDGMQIAFSSNRDGNYEIYTMNKDGSNQTRKTFLPNSYDFQPRWSPDGTELVFTGETSDNADIYKLNLSTLEVTQLTNHPAYHASPGYSPTGDFIVFDSQRTGHADIYIMNSDGTNVVNYTNTLGIHEISPMWSPVENKIAFQKEIGDYWEIMILDLDNNTLQQLTYINADNQQPAWSDFGSQIVFMTRQDPGPYHEISIIDTTGDNLHHLTENVAQDWYPAFQPGTASGVEQGLFISPQNDLCNYPNPFNPATTISFSLTTKITENTELLIYNLKGQKINQYSIFNNQSSIIWDGTDQSGNSVSSGIYYYKLNIPQSPVKKMVLLK